MRIVNAAELLQAAPGFGAAARLLHQLVIDDDLLQAIVGVSHQQARHLVEQIFRLARQEFGYRHQIGTPPYPGNPGEMLAKARVAGRKIDEREGEVLRYELMLLVLVVEALQRPIEIDLRIGVKREPRCPVRSGRRIIDEGRKRPGLRGGGGHQIGRNTTPLAPEKTLNKAGPG